MKKTIQTKESKKKTFVKPQMKAVQLMSESILTGSDGQGGGPSGTKGFKTESLKEEDYKF